MKRSSALNRVLEQLLELYLVNVTLKNLGNILRVSSMNSEYNIIVLYISLNFHFNSLST